MNKVRRVDAIAVGMQRYFTSKACKAGHFAERYTANGHCIACQAEYSATEQVRAKQEQYRSANKPKQAQRYAEWYAENKDKKLGYMRDYSKTVALPRVKQRYREDLVFAVATRARARLAKAIQRTGYAKNSKTHELIGCSYKELAAHLEAQFVDDMGWHNRADWHIDHIVPVASAKTEEELLNLFHFTNLQPLWADENRRKGARVGASQC
jgi:hypothetical protein